jgi:hypothetical protein
MFPAAPFNDRLDVTVVNIELRRDLPPTHASRGEAANFSNVVRSEADGDRGVPALRVHVSDVLKLSAETQMVRPYATCIVAGVANDHSLRDRASRVT